MCRVIGITVKYEVQLMQKAYEITVTGAIVRKPLEPRNGAQFITHEMACIKAHEYRTACKGKGASEFQAIHDKTFPAFTGWEVAEA